MKKFFLTVLISLPVIVQAQRNSQWRGENRDGIYNETGLLKKWASDGPRLAWKFEGLGEGHTSVAIANENIYATGLHGDKLVLYVFDMDGKLIREKNVGKEWNKNHDGARSTVCINDGKLYIFNALGTLFCLDEATLNEVWKKDLLQDFDGRNIMWGMTESPLIVGEKIFMTPGGVKHNIVALNKNTGALIWTSPGVGTPSSYCSPLYIGDQSVPMVVTYFVGKKKEGRVYDNKIAAFNANTGDLLWTVSQPSENDINPNTPIYYDGMIFSIVGYKGGAWLIRLKDGGKAAEIVWHNKEMDNQMGGAIKAGDYLYASGHRDRNWFCVDWKTGKTVYKVNELAPCNVIYADGMLYCYSEAGGGSMHIVKPNPEKFELLSSFKVTLGTGPHWAHPVIHKGVLYIRHGDALMAYKISEL